MKHSIGRLIRAKATHPARMFWLTALVWLGIDQIVKFMQLNTMSVGDSVPLIEGVFHLTYVENRGAAFSILGGQVYLFIVAAALFLVGVAVYWRYEHPRDCVPIVGVGLVAAGAVGNAIDRLLYGHVIDIFDTRIINFAVFNVADTGITVGIALLIIWYLLFAGAEDDE